MLSARILFDGLVVSLAGSCDNTGAVTCSHAKLTQNQTTTHPVEDFGSQLGRSLAGHGLKERLGEDHQDTATFSTDTTFLGKSSQGGGWLAVGMGK